MTPARVCAGVMLFQNDTWNGVSPRHRKLKNAGGSTIEVIVLLSARERVNRGGSPPLFNRNSRLPATVLVWDGVYTVPSGPVTLVTWLEVSSQKWFGHAADAPAAGVATPAGWVVFPIQPARRMEEPARSPSIVSVRIFSLPL